MRQEVEKAKILVEKEREKLLQQRKDTEKLIFFFGKIIYFYFFFQSLLNYVMYLGYRRIFFVFRNNLNSRRINYLQNQRRGILNNDWNYQNQLKKLN